MLQKKLLAFPLAIIVGVGFLAHCVSSSHRQLDPRGEAFAPNSSCIACHQDVAASWFHSVHALASRLADSSLLRGIFNPPGIVVSYGRHGKLVMESRDSGFYQLALIGDRLEAHRIDIVIGRGRQAQMYLYWKGDRLFQLPASYFTTTKTWTNSPGFPQDSIWFGRSIATECFECHASFIRHRVPARAETGHQPENFGRNSLLPGIDCQRCHGPAAQHVDWHTRHPDEKRPRFITLIDTLPRQERLDACAVCHSGIHPEQLSLFRFRPGHRLANYYFAAPIAFHDTDRLDIHGNPYQLLRESKCFQHSTLDCMTCHEPHRPGQSLEIFTAACRSCHNPVPDHAHIDETTLGAKCIDCHMPSRPSTITTLHDTAGPRSLGGLLRTHRIGIYPPAADQAPPSIPKREDD